MKKIIVALVLSVFAFQGVDAAVAAVKLTVAQRVTKLEKKNIEFENRIKELEVQLSAIRSDMNTASLTTERSKACQTMDDLIKEAAKIYPCPKENDNCATVVKNRALNVNPIEAINNEFIRTGGADSYTYADKASKFSELSKKYNAAKKVCDN